MKTENSNIGTYQFLAEPFHVDCTGRLTMSIVGNHLLNCAGMHAAKRGFGITDLNEHHYTWVLSRLAMEFTDLPMQYDAFSISTWVEAVYSLFTDRNFALYNARGEAIGYARSVWAMIDLDSRRYIEHILDLLPLEKHKTECLKRFEIAYITESYFGDQLDLYMDTDAEANAYTVEIRKHFTGEVVCRAKMLWHPRP